MHIEFVLVALLVAIVFIVDRTVYMILRCLRRNKNRTVEQPNNLNEGDPSRRVSLNQNNH